MCEASAYLLKDDGTEELIMEAVDIIEPNKNGIFCLTGIFGDQISIKGNIKKINLVDHKILFCS